MRDFLRGLELEEDTVDVIMAEYGKATTKYIEQISNLTEANKKFEGIDIEKLNNDLKNWETKYNADMMAKDKAFAKERLFNNIQFASAMAKNGAMAEFDAKDFEFKDGNFIGADDFIKGLKASDPNAFKVEQPNITTGKSMNDGNAKGEEMDGVMKRFLELNPNIKIK